MIGLLADLLHPEGVEVATSSLRLRYESHSQKKIFLENETCLCEPLPASLQEALLRHQEK